MSTELIYDSAVKDTLTTLTVRGTDNLPVWKKYTLFGLLASLYLLPFMPIYLLGTDEGTLDYGAVRIAQGQVFTRDFFEVIGPGTFYSLAAFFKLFGVSFLVSRVYLFLISLGTALLMYFLSRRLCRTHQALASIFLAATSFGLLWPEVGHHVDSNFYALITAACILLWYERRSKFFLFAAGVSAGITSVVLQPKGFLLFVALLVWLLILRKRRETSLSSLGHVMMGYFGVLSRRPSVLEQGCFSESCLRKLHLAAVPLSNGKHRNIRGRRGPEFSQPRGGGDQMDHSPGGRTSYALSLCRSVSGFIARHWSAPSLEPKTSRRASFLVMRCGGACFRVAQKRYSSPRIRIALSHDPLRSPFD